MPPSLKMFLGFVGPPLKMVLAISNIAPPGCRVPSLKMAPAKKLQLQEEFPANVLLITVTVAWPASLPSFMMAPAYWSA